MTATVLVTGGAGFIGSHTCKALAAHGYTPVVVDNLTNGRRGAVKWGPIEVGDVRDEGWLVDVFRRHAPVAVLHFAGLIEAGRSVTEPHAFYDVNVGGTVRLLSAMRRVGCRQVVFSSTAAVYGNPETVPIGERHPRVPVSPYGRSKLMVEQILADVNAADELAYSALRYFNAAGADPEADLWEAHEPETHLIPLALDAALGRRPPLQLFGTDYDTHDGTCVRDYVHVADLADAHVRALTRMLAGGSGIVANLGTGAGFSVREVLQAVERATGRPVPAEAAPRRPGDPGVLVADGGLARSELAWAPQVTDLPTIVRHAMLARPDVAAGHAALAS
jgi:UDP-arabinose 4-epimerase